PALRADDHTKVGHHPADPLDEVPGEWPEERRIDDERVQLHCRELLGRHRSREDAVLGARPLQALRQDADEPGVVVEHGYAEWSLRAHGLRGMVVARGAATATVHTTFTSNPATSGVVGFAGYMPINPTIAAGRPGEVLCMFTARPVAVTRLHREREFLSRAARDLHPAPGRAPFSSPGRSLMTACFN